MRKLASIQTIVDIQPIPKSDYLERVTVLGWHCVVKKDEFKVGDKIVYVEVDSILPDGLSHENKLILDDLNKQLKNEKDKLKTNKEHDTTNIDKITKEIEVITSQNTLPQYEFLRSRKFRVRTIKLRKQISQGLILPLYALVNTKINIKTVKIDTDVTTALGVIKYLTPSEKEELNQQLITKHWTKNYKLTKKLWRYKWFRNIVQPVKQKGFPKWVIKTDEERVQRLEQLINDYKDYDVTVTEKIDYQSATFSVNTNKKKLFGNKTNFVVCSRNQKNNQKLSLYGQIASKYNLKKILTPYKNITVQGEQGSSKVQGNKYKLTSPKMWVFHITKHDKNLNRYYYDYNEMNTFCIKHKLDIVPLIKQCKLHEIGNTIDEMVDFSKGKSKINPKIEREGVVVSCIKDGKKEFSFKIINPNFLLKFED